MNKSLIFCAILFSSIGYCDNLYDTRVPVKIIKDCIYECRGQDKLFGDCSSNHCNCGPDLTEEQKKLPADVIYNSIFHPGYKE
jgi:hypothetical protein